MDRRVMRKGNEATPYPLPAIPLPSLHHTILGEGEVGVRGHFSRFHVTKTITQCLLSALLYHTYYL